MVLFGFVGGTADAGNCEVDVAGKAKDRSGAAKGAGESAEAATPSAATEAKKAAPIEAGMVPM